MQEIGFQSFENPKFSRGSMPPDPSRTLVALLLNRRLSNFSPGYAPLICLKPMISRRRLFTILRLNYIVNQATLIKVKNRCAKFTSRLPSLISPKHLKTWSKLSQKFGQSIRSPPQYRSLRDVPELNKPKTQPIGGSALQTNTHIKFMNIFWYRMYRLKPQRELGNLFSINNGCPFLQAGIANISFVKDLIT